jgi:hypothetical protein
MKRIVIILLTAASLAHANTRTELDELNKKQRQARQSQTFGRSAPYRVHYSIRGSGRDITVLAESSSEARRVVMDMFPGALVTGVHKIGR